MALESVPILAFCVVIIIKMLTNVDILQENMKVCTKFLVSSSKSWDISLKVKSSPPQSLVTGSKVIRIHLFVNLMSVTFMVIDPKVRRYFSRWPRQNDYSRVVLQAWLKMIKAYIILYVFHVSNSDTSSSVAKSIHSTLRPLGMGNHQGHYLESESLCIFTSLQHGTKFPLSSVIFNKTVLGDIADHQAWGRIVDM